MCAKCASSSQGIASLLSSSWPQLVLAASLGLVFGWLNYEPVISFADGLSQIFINFLKMVSLPIIFLSIISTATRMEGFAEIRTLGQRVVKYTLLTTVIAASIALFLFVVIDPLSGESALSVAGSVASSAVEPGDAQGYLAYLLATVPSNIVEPFLSNNVIGVLFMAIVFSAATLTLPTEQRETLRKLFAALYSVVMKVTQYLIRLMPIAVGAFVTLFVNDVQNGLDVGTVALYLLVVVLANLIQGFVVLPLLLRAKGLSPWRVFQGMAPALSVAFFAKSSSAALPMAMECSEKRVGVSRKVASFSLPLCTTINMNGCAAFILTTVLFVSMSHGVTYTLAEMLPWIFIATIAAVGNAGVPMGCYFLSSALLASMNVPLNIMGVILPFYAMIDMLESAINVWSDSCVTAIVDRELQEAPVQVLETAEALS